MPMYWEDNVAYNLSTTTSLMQLIWDYQISGNTGKKIKQIGNAVPPPLIEMIVKELVK